MDQRRAPLAEQLQVHTVRQAARFHVPGHKGRAVPGEAAMEPFAEVLAYDVTELPGLDDLHAADGVIAEAQRLAAACYGADRTFFLVGGSTSGNLAAVLAACERGDLALIQRNAHKSVFHALELAGVRAVFVPPAVCPETGIAGGVDTALAIEALQRYPQAKAVFVTNPGYYGTGADLSALARAAHERGLPLVVDEAHGAHFGFHPELPPSALSMGADMVIQSTHKTGLAMTMGAMLHVRGERVNIPRVARRLAMLQTSSPSYPIMASLDLARRWMALHGRERFAVLLADIAACAAHLAEDPDSALIPVSPRAEQGLRIDPLKLILRHRDPAVTGYALSERLAERRIDVEMADLRHVVLALGPGTKREDLERLIAAAATIPTEPSQHDRPQGTSGTWNAWQAVTALGQADISEPIDCGADFPEDRAAIAVPLAASMGALSAEAVIPYPPGIPLILRGERITAATVAAVSAMAEAGARFQGMSDATGKTIRVWK